LTAKLRPPAIKSKSETSACNAVHHACDSI
jgi:hypothetical protein